MDFQALLEQLNSDLEDIQARRKLLDEEEEVIYEAIGVVEKLMTLRGSVLPKKPQATALGPSDCARCGARKHRGACRGARPKKSSPSQGRPRVEPSKIETAAALVRGGKTIGEAAATVGVHRNTLGPLVRDAATPKPDTKLATCGKCTWRGLNTDKPLLGVQPDCVTHNRHAEA